MNVNEFKWYECRPGNMPEDFFLEQAKESNNGTMYIGPFIGYNKSDWGESYCICSRYIKANCKRWTWSGSHPIAWATFPNCTI